MIVVAGGSLAGWFIVTAPSIELSFDPPPERVELEGSIFRWRVGDAYRVRPGTYTVRARRTGYHPLDEPIVVEREGERRFHFDLDKLPGLVAFHCVGANDPEAALDAVRILVDGRDVGRTPTDEVEIDAGPHTVRVEHERYQDVEAVVEVIGTGRRQRVSVELRPDWAQLEIATQPVSAQLSIDGQVVATTPCIIDVLSGARELRLEAERFQTWSRTIEVVAEQPMTLTDIVLLPSPGQLVVETEPAGAQVMVDGVYAGTTPLETPVAPDEELLVQVSRVGYDPAQRTVRVASAETETVTIELAQRFGAVRLEITPPDAMLTVDGKPWGAVPEEITLSAVEHRLEFSKDGFVAQARTITPGPDLVEKITLELESIALNGAKGDRTWEASNGYRFALIEPAAFTMGSSRREQGRRSNETLREIKLERAFLFGMREVTNDEFRAFKADHRSGVADGVRLDQKTQPVVNVTWDDAARFCNWLSGKDGLPPAYVERAGKMYAAQPMTIGYRLPTEAEWAYCARVAGALRLLKYPWGGVFPPRDDKTGNYADQSATSLIITIPEYEDGYPGPAPVGSFDSNGFGVHDLGGNVAEWCHDFYTIYTYDAEQVWVDPMGPERGQHHVIRGSSWRHASMSTLRFAYRDYSEEPRDDVGFRLCRYRNDPETDR